MTDIYPPTFPTVDRETKLFPQPTMDALEEAIGVSPERIEEAVDDYLAENPPGEPELEAHIVSETPHPVYDDMPSLTLIFENGIT